MDEVYKIKSNRPYIIAVTLEEGGKILEGYVYDCRGARRDAIVSQAELLERLRNGNCNVDKFRTVDDNDYLSDDCHYDARICALFLRDGTVFDCVLGTFRHLYKKELEHEQREDNTLREKH